MNRQTRGFVIILGVIVLHAQNVFGQYLPPSQVDFFSTPPASVSDVASALDLQVDGKVTGLFAGESLMGLLGPNGAGKTTLLGGHGFTAGDKVKLTNGGGKLTIERLGGAPLSIHLQMDDFMRPDGVEEMTSALGMQLVGKTIGLFAGQHLSVIVGASGSGKSTLISTRGFSAGQKVKVTNAGGGKLTIERLGGAALTMHVNMDDFFRPAGVKELASALGLQIEGKATGLFAGQSLNTKVGTGSKMLFDRGYIKGNRVKVTNAGRGKLTIERISGGAPLTIHVHMDDFFHPQAVEEIASALGLQVDGKAGGLFTRQSLNAGVGTGSKIMFDKGYLKGNRVKVTNAGGGKLKIERLGGAPLTIHVHMEEFY